MHKMLSAAMVIGVAAYFAAPALGQSVAQTGGGHNHDPGAPMPQSSAASWTTYPVIAPVKGRFSRSAKRVALKNIKADHLDVWRSLAAADTDKSKTSITAENGVYAVKSDGMGGYSVIVARQETPEEVLSAASTVYFSMPAPAPRAMLALVKSELEVTPDPLPREHQHFQENTGWGFIVRFNGQPLAKKEVHFQTAYGTKRQLLTDEKGKVLITFPEDFPDKQDDHNNNHGRRYAPFVVATSHADNGRHYTSAFNDLYAPGPYKDKSVWAGYGFLALGMISALPLLHRKRKKGAIQ